MIRLHILLVCLFCLIYLNAHAAKIYKWVGPDGQVHYTSTPPPEVDAKSTGMDTSTQQERASDKDERKNPENEEALTDEERIRRLEEKIKELEAKDAATTKSDSTDKLTSEEGSNSEQTEPEEDKQPDYSLQGQVRMIEEENRRQQMMIRCRAKAPHGIDCTKAEHYEKY